MLFLGESDKPKY